MEQVERPELEPPSAPLLDEADDDLGLLDEAPWDVHELEKELEEEKSFD
jgi:translation elongation factor P/translation initiation factor 5A